MRLAPATNPPSCPDCDLGPSNAPVRSPHAFSLCCTLTPRVVTSPCVFTLLASRALLSQPPCSLPDMIPSYLW